MNTVCRSFARRTRLVILLTIPCLATLTGTKATADGFISGTINFDYNHSAYGYAPFGPGPAVIGSAGDFWNTIGVDNVGEYVSPLSLNNAEGASTSVQWSYSGGGGIANTVAGIYGRLLDVSTVISSASITGLTPNQEYRLYLFSVYFDQVMSVNGIDFTTQAAQFPIANSLIAGVHYDVHTVTADSSGTLAFVPVFSAGGFTDISSWQLTPVPEPSVISLAGFALLALRLTRSRKRCD